MKHLNLTQCKKLKEIGYPQKNPEYFIRKEGFPCHNHETDESIGMGTYGDEVACPTLEELIEWLGEDLAGVEHSREESKEYGPRWYAAAWESNGLIGKGETPLEAVYDLAIAIKND